MFFEDEEEEDEYCCNNNAGSGGSKKRRLGTEQVRALEQSFEIENRLEPDRKARLARDLGLQPRQVAVWFQNRRARWKTKQLERDFSALKSRYDALRLDLESLRRENGSLAVQLAGLREKVKPAVVGGFGGEGFCESDSSGVLNGGGDIHDCSRNEEILKVEEEDDDDGEDWGGEELSCGAGLFDDVHGSTLAWFSAELAGDNNGCW